jgi:type I restriction enzyme R subunit/putative DNA methylase
LPHRDVVGLLQAITFRLADSLPQAKLAELELELEHLPEDRRSTERHRRIEQWLDAGMGCRALGHPAVAKVVQDSLLHFDGERYRLLCWCVMPNHVHVLIEPRQALAGVVQGWKSFTARWALARNDALGLGIPDPKHLWMREYWDRYMRDEGHLRRSIDYIHNNPVKAGLCHRPEDWPWSSARNADVPVGNRNADVPVGNRNADVPVGNRNADVPVGNRNADVPVGNKPDGADGDVGVPGNP